MWTISWSTRCLLLCFLLAGTLGGATPPLAAHLGLMPTQPSTPSKPTPRWTPSCRSRSKPSLAQDPEALEKTVRELAGSPLAGEPIETFHYASANFNTLGLLVQTVANQPFSDYLKQHVFGPLDMVHSHPARAAARAGQRGRRAFPLVQLVLALDRRPGSAEDLPLLLEHQGEWGNGHTYLAMVPDSGLGLAIVWSIPRTGWLLATIRAAAPGIRGVHHAKPLPPKRARTKALPPPS